MQLNDSRFRNPDLPVSSACDSQSCVRKVSHVKEIKWVLQELNWNWCKALQTAKVMKSSIKVRCKERCSLISTPLGHKHPAHLYGRTVCLMMWSEVIFVREQCTPSHPSTVCCLPCLSSYKKYENLCICLRILQKEKTHLYRVKWIVCSTLN